MEWEVETRGKLEGSGREVGQKLDRSWREVGGKLEGSWREVESIEFFCFV